jgi:choline dehydrogenase-like flavoprotein
MVYFRGHARDYDDWSKAGATGWSYREVLPYFRKSEDNENFASSEFHGRGGAMRIRTVTRPNPLNFAFFNALAGLGIQARADLNGADSEGMALRQVAIRAGSRETTASALLYPALRRSNLTVLTGAQATQVVLEGRRAVAVKAHSRQGSILVQARREVVLTAGSIQSPQLLLLSGVGDGEHLASAGIPVRHHLPGVGRNLHDHLASPVHMSTARAVSYGISWRSTPRNMLSLAEYLLFRSGPLANNVFESAAFVKTAPGLDRPDVQLVFQSAKRPPPGFPFPLGHGFAISPVGLYPRSRGRITLASPDPFTAPLIDPNLLAVPEDVMPLIRGIRLARQILRARAFEPYGAHETAPGIAAETDAELIDYIRAQAYTVHHPVSTCRMGTDPMAVVDPQLRVIGLEGVRVADASVFPSLIGGNTNAAVVMIAEKAADLILGRAALEPATIGAPAEAQTLTQVESLNG